MKKQGFKLKKKGKISCSKCEVKFFCDFKAEPNEELEKLKSECIELDYAYIIFEPAGKLKKTRF